MSILVIGVNHRSGPLALLERVTLAPDAIGKAVVGLAARDNVREVAVLSTCNRTEVYAVTEKFHGAYADIRDFLCDIGHLAPDELHPYLFAQHDDAAVSHLFEVASGLDSAVIGESEILGQVRQAWEIAQSEGGTRGSLNLLFRHALSVGKRARTETGIGRGTASVSHAAVEMAVDQLGGLEGKRVLVVGAGTMGEGVAVALHRAGAGEILVANRSADRGSELADRVGGVAIGFDRLGAAIADADLVLTCTGAGEPILTVDFLASVRPSARPLLIVDIAVPRDVEAAVERAAERADPRPRRSARLGRPRPITSHGRSRTGPRDRPRGSRAIQPAGHRAAGGSARHRHAGTRRDRPGRRARAVHVATGRARRRRT